MINSILPKYLLKNTVRVFSVACFLTVLFQVSLFSQTTSSNPKKQLSTPIKITNKPTPTPTPKSPTPTPTSPTLTPTTGTYFYVAPNGNSSATGSKANPWDLKTALKHPASVKPGATIWLRGGTYRIPSGDLGFTSAVSGSSASPIKIASFPGEWAVIDGNLSNSAIKNKTIITNNGSYVWFMNFEITNTETGNRKIDIAGSNPSGRRGSSIYDYGTGTKIINLVIHDTGQGIGAWSKGQDNEYYGNIVYNNGWDAPDRLHGNGTYTQNNAGTKVFEDNIFFNPVGLNVRMGGTTSASTRNYSWIGNVFFNGRMVLDGPNIENLRVLHNYTYNNKLPIGSAVKSTFVNAEVRGNYLIGGVQLFEFTNNVTFTNNTVWDNNPTGNNLVINTKSLWQPTKFSIDNNTYYKAFHQRPFWQFKINYKGTDAAVKAALDGFYAFNKTNGSQGRTFSYTKKSWQDDLKIDLNSTYIDAVPSETKIFVKRNKYDSKRLHIIIYNWKQADTVGVDVSSMLRAGDTYELRNVQNFFGDVIVGTYNGRLVINMKNRTLAKPIGYNQVSKWYHDPLKPNTFPTFGVFILIKTN